MNGWVICKPREEYNTLLVELEEAELQMARRGYAIQVMIARDWRERFIPFVKAVKYDGLVGRKPRNS